MKKLITILALTSIVGAFIVGCGPKEEATTETTPPATDTPATDPAPEAEAAAPMADDAAAPAADDAAAPAENGG